MKWRRDSTSSGLVRFGAGRGNVCWVAGGYWDFARKCNKFTQQQMSIDRTWRVQPKWCDFPLYFFYFIEVTVCPFIIIVIIITKRDFFLCLTVLGGAPMAARGGTAHKCPTLAPAHQGECLGEIGEYNKDLTACSHCKNLFSDIPHGHNISHVYMIWTLLLLSQFWFDA